MSELEFQQAEIQPNTGKMRVGLTAAAVGAWSNVDYLIMIAGGEILESQGVNGWVAAGATAVGTLVETTLVSRATLAVMGDYSHEPKNIASKSMAAASPLVSLWRGAPTGVMIDKAAGKDTGLKRTMLVHSLPYAVAVGAWVSPNPVSETVVGTAETAAIEVVDTTRDAATEYPVATGGFGLAVALSAGAFLSRRRKNKASHA